MKYQCLCGDDCEPCKICRFPACECTCSSITGNFDEDDEKDTENDDNWG